MKKLIGSIGVFLLFCSCDELLQGDIQDQKTEENMKKLTGELVGIENHPVVFYNVENLFDTEDDLNNRGDDEFTPSSDKLWDTERYQTKLNHIAEALLMANNETPLFVGFAELENRKVLEDLIKVNTLKNVNYKIVHFDSNDGRGVDCGFIYDADRFLPTFETRLIVKMDGNPNFTTRDILYIKGKLANNDEVHVFVNHWSSRREGQFETEPKRLEAAKVLRKQIDEILDFNPEANIVVMGDFNDTPNDKSMREVLLAKGQHEQSNRSLINLLVEEQNKDLGTINYRGDWDVFDQIIVSQGLLQGKNKLSVFKNNAFIVKKEELLYTYKNGDQKPSSTYGGDNYYGGYSDHLPVYMLLEEK